MSPEAVPPTRDSKTESRMRDKRILEVDRTWSRKDRQFHYSRTAKVKSNRDTFRKYALVVCRDISLKGVVSGIEIEVRSGKLAELLSKILKGVPDLELTRDPPVITPRILFHTKFDLITRRQEEEEKEGDSDTELVEDINAALDYIEVEFSSTTANLGSLLKHGDITYDLLWAVFKPNAVVFTEKNQLREPQAVKFCSCSYEETQQQGKYLEIETRMIHHDGDEFGWGSATLQIPYFDGGKKIASLAAYPLEFHPQADKVRSLLLERGRKYISIVNKPVCMGYHDLAVYQDKNLDQSEEKRFSATGRIMLDPSAFRSVNPNADDLLRPSVYEDDAVDAAMLSDADLILCSHRILGFSFAQKRWGAFAVSSMHDVVWDEKGFKNLVLDDKKRRMISLLVKSHRTDEGSFDDIVKGKGRGLVGLLSGSPGVGKTLTAEVVAELSQRPLYAVSAGELGTTVEKVDEQLGMVLDITRRWGCVLLIDEADVFLHKRGDAELQRNALVSVFLRRLEYFQGIVILTTNRRKDIDEAFESRIHFKYHYPALNADDRRKIWKNLLESANISDLDLNDEDLTELARHPLNGREIKNAVSCAVSIIRAGEGSLTLEFVKEILESIIDDEGPG